MWYYFKNMTIIEIFLTGFSLSLDAVAVAIAASALNRNTRKQALKIALFFGLFQAFMPLVGWGLGFGFKEYVEAYGSIIGFILLFGVGLNMLKETLSSETEEDVKKERHLSETKVLTVMAFATSIDALVVGITFNFVKVSVPFAVTVIGIVTFILSLFALYVGGKYKHSPGKKIEIFGALILIGLAIKILMGW